MGLSKAMRSDHVTTALVVILACTLHVTGLRCFNTCDCGPAYVKCATPDTLTSWPIFNDTEYMKNITSIVIDHQPRLDRLPVDALSMYTNLKELTVSRCGLSNVHVDNFSGNKHITYLDLQFNNLSTISWKAIENLELQKLILVGNPLVCNCSIRWLQVLHSDILARTALGASLQCVKSGTLGQQKENLPTAEITGCDKPKSTVSLNVSVVNSTDSLTVSCRGWGQPAPTVTWDTSKLVSMHSVQTSSDGLVQNLTLHSVHSNDSRAIRCITQNIVGRDIQTLALYVNSKPSITQLNEPFEMFHWCIYYEVKGYPTPTRTWYHNGRPLKPTNRPVDKFVTVSTTDTDELDVHTGCLEFITASHGYNGQYTLEVKNAFGSDRKTIYASFLRHPGTRFPSWKPEPGKPSRHNGNTRNVSKGPLGSPSTAGTKGTDGEKSELNEDREARDRTIYITVSLVVIATLGCVATFVGVRLYRRRKTLRNGETFSSTGSRHPLTRYSEDKSVNGNVIASEHMPLNPLNVVENPNYLPKQEVEPQAIRHFNSKQLQFIRELGEGAFGRVYLGMCEGLQSEGDSSVVAVKTLKDMEVEEARRDFDRESEMLAGLNHEHIVTFYGICTDSQPWMMIFEFMENGDLNNFLRSHGPDAAFLCSTAAQNFRRLRMNELIFIARQIASGVAYLASQHFVHRDLATRNCLVGDKLIVKIGDFGMSRDVYTMDYYRVVGQTMLPVRWMPPESILYRKFTTESDCWSFGVVLWEIFTYGKQPWYELSNHEVIQYIQNGKLLDCPRQCPEEIYKLMLGCWRRQPKQRMSINETYEVLLTLDDDNQKNCVDSRNAVF